MTDFSVIVDCPWKSPFANGGLLFYSSFPGVKPSPWEEGVFLGPNCFLFLPSSFHLLSFSSHTNGPTAREGVIRSAGIVRGIVPGQAPHANVGKG